MNKMATLNKSEEIAHLECPFVECGSSDAFSYNTAGYGKCHSCGKSYPHSGMKVHSWANDVYPTGSNTPDVEIIEETPVKPAKTDYHPYRGILDSTMRFYGVKTDFNAAGEPFQHGYVYPSGGVKYRVFPKTFRVSNFKADQLFGMDKFPAGCAKAVTITEGELDAMSAYQMLGSKYPVVSLPSATPSRKLLENTKEWLGSFEKIYLSLDADDKAEGFALTLMRLFPGRVYKVPHDKYKDANEFLQDGAGTAYRSAWWASGLYTPDNIYASEDAFLKLYQDTPNHQYVPTGIKALDEKILGVMQGHFTVIKAPTGIGKSEFMRFLEYNFIKNHPDVRFAVWHLEETKLRSLLGVVSYQLSDNVTRKDLIESKGREADVERAIKEISHNSGYMQFHLREEDGIEELLEQIRVLSQVYGCQYILFEPIQDAVSTGDEKAKESILADLSIRLSKLCADLNVGVITIAHTNENGDPKYCKMIAQRASVVIDLERDKDAQDLLEKNTTRIYVKKNRPCGLEGPAGEMVFDIESFTLEEK